MEDESTDEYDEGSSSDVEDTDVVVAEVIGKSSGPEPPSQQEIEKAQKQILLSSQSRNFGITTALWSSLFFDTILNKAKRAELFPTLPVADAVAVEGAAVSAAAASSLKATLVPTALLASGFALASCVSFLLWRDLDVMASEDDELMNKGDWFLSLSTLDDKKLAKQTRRRLYLHLSLFGILSLGAHAGMYYTEQAPFLGLSAAAINVHNTLACVNALMKETTLAELGMKIVTWPLSLFQQGDGDGKKSQDATSFLFQLSALVFLVRCIPATKTMISLGKSLSSLVVGAETAISHATMVNNARHLSLQVASLARLSLAAGVAQTLHNAAVSNSKHPFFAALSGMASLACFGVGGSILFSSLTTGLHAIPLDGLVLALMGVVSGYSSITGFLKAKEGSAY